MFDCEYITPSGRIFRVSMPDFHIYCGNEDGYDATSKYGAGPVVPNTDIDAHPPDPKKEKDLKIPADWKARFVC
jgi:hypothetical protein